MITGPVLDNSALHIFAVTVDDLEKVRCASENRFRQMTRTEVDKDGKNRGFGLTTAHPDVQALATLTEALKQLEHQAILDLRRTVRKHPLWPMFAEQRGVGEKQFARFLASIGDPAWNDSLNQPRTIGQLKAYCGLHVIGGSGIAGIAPKRQRGHQNNWNEDARKRLWLIASSIITANMGKNATKPNRSKYAKVYETARFEQYSDAVHELPCIRCGPSGKPAPAGTPLSDGHKHARAIRKVMDAILHDLYYTAKQPRRRGTDPMTPTTNAGAAPRSESPLGVITDSPGGNCHHAVSKIPIAAWAAEPPGMQS